MYSVVVDEVDTLRKTTRTVVTSARQKNPCATLQQISDEVGVTRERVRQILRDVGLPTAHLVRRYVCLSCGTVLPLRCRKFCNRQCQHNYTHIKVACDYCGTLREYRVKELINHIEKGQKQEHYWCSKRCQGKWLAENHGFSVYPEHALMRWK